MKKFINKIILLVAISCNAYAQLTDKIDPFIGDWHVNKGKYFAQVYLVPDGEYKVNIVSDLTSVEHPLAILTGKKISDNAINLSGDG